MSRRFCAALGAIAAGLILGGCSTNPESGCSQPPVQTYPAVHLVSPSSGQTGVEPAIGWITVTTSGSQLYGTLTLTGPSGTVNLEPKPTANSESGSGLNFTARLPMLQTTASYSVRYTLQYPGGCQGPNIVNTQSVGQFTTE
jgi:hypothetical protein